MGGMFSTTARRVSDSNSKTPLEEEISLKDALGSISPTELSKKPGTMTKNPAGASVRKKSNTQSNTTSHS